MENREYTVPIEQLNQHLKSVGVPRKNVTIHYWYEVDDGRSVQVKKKRNSIKTAPAFGIWKGREDMADPTEYVQNLRKARCFE